MAMSMRWQYRDPMLAWLFPVAYLCHLLEEWFGGFPEWIAAIAGRPVPRPAFLVINAVALVIMLLATRAAIRKEQHGWMGIAIATVVLLNAVLHLLGSIVTGTYSPGLITGVILYMPLGQLTLLRAWHQAEGSAMSRGVSAALAIHGLVIAIAWLATITA